MLPKDAEFQIPEYIDKIVDLATTLAKGFQHVRVDLYDVNGQILFGEMTFTSGSGLVKYVPDEIDFWLGEKWKIRNID